MLSVALLLGHAAPALAQTEASHQQFLFAYKLLQRGDDELAADEFDTYLGEYPAAPKRGDAMYYRALLHRRAGENEAAATLLEQAPDPQLVPQYAAHLLRGQALSDLQRYDEALTVLERIDLDGLDPQIAVSVRYLMGLVYRGAGNLDAAAASLTAAAELDTPMRARALLDLARVQALRDNTEDAIQTLQRCLEIADGATAAEAAHLAGDFSYERDQYDQALRFYNRVLNGHQSSPHFGPAVVGALWAHFAAERYGTVLETFAQHRDELSGDDRVQAWYLAGAAHQESDEHDRAAALLSEVARNDSAPIQEKILYRLAVSLFELEAYDGMRRAVETLAARFPQSERRVEAAYMLAAAEAETGDLQRGASRLSELIEQGEDHPYHRPALLRRARLYEAHDEPAAAARDYGRFVAAARNAGDASDTVRQAALRRINLLYRLGEHEQTRTDAQALLEQPDLEAATQQEALYHQALAELKLGQREQALATFQRLDEAHEVHPYRAESLYYRGLLHMSLDQGDRAAPLLERAAGQDKLEASHRAGALRLLAIHQRRNDEPAAVVRQTLSRLESLVDRDGLNTTEQLWLGRDAVQRDPEQAVAYLEPLTDPDRGAAEPRQRAEATFLLGRAQRALGDHEAAVAAFQRVTAMGQGFGMRAQLELARTLHEGGDLEQAISAYSTPANADSDELVAEARYGLGRAHRELAAQARRQGNTDTAQEHQREARSHFKRIALLYTDPRFEPLPQLSYIELAELALEQEAVDEAQAELEELIDAFSVEGESDGPYVTLGRALLAESRQRFGEAQALLERLRDRGDELDARLQRRVSAGLSRLEGRR
ncbi:MAG: tetratricopeptide repeat protein [Phycisphaeraceae bacterium]